MDNYYKGRCFRLSSSIGRNGVSLLGRKSEDVEVMYELSFEFICISKMTLRKIFQAEGKA